MRLKLYLKAYLGYLKRAAIGIPASLVSEDIWRDVPDAIREIAGTLVALIICSLLVITYPVSVFVVSAIAFERDRRAERRHAEWLKSLDFE
jgi:hypothetical protein